MIISLRRAIAADARAAADVWLRSRHASVPAIPQPTHTDDEVRAHFANVLIPKRETWVAEDGEGEIAGVLVLEDDCVDQLYVDPRHTGRGIGSEFVDLAKRERPRELQLWTFQSNAGARRFYERHGFEPVEFTDGSTNEERSPDVRYRWIGATVQQPRA